MNQNLLLGPKIKRLCNAFDQAANRSAEEFGLTGSQAFLISFIAHHEQPVYARDLENRFKLRHPTISGMLQRMENKEFIYCVPDETDRRCKRIFLTEKGIRIHDLAVARLEAVEQTMAAGFSPEERLQFSELLDKAIGNIGQKQPPFPLSEEREDPEK